MEIKTKFNVNQTAFVMVNNKPTSRKITGVGTFTGIRRTDNNGNSRSTVDGKVNVEYYLENFIEETFHEEDVFESMESLKESLFPAIGNAK